MATTSGSAPDWRGEHGGRLVLGVIAPIFAPGVVVGLITGKPLVAAITAAGAGCVALLLLVLYVVWRGMRVGIAEMRHSPPQ